MHQILLAADKSSCGMSNRQHGHWVSSRSLELIDARRHMPAGSEHTENRKELLANLRASLKRDRESWWSVRASEMEVAAALGNHRKLFCLIGEAGSRRPGVSETICDESGQSIHNLSKRLECWAVHLAKQFNRPELDFSPATDRLAPWAVPSDPPSRSEVELIRCIHVYLRSIRPLSFLHETFLNSLLWSKHNSCGLRTVAL
ncbi:unnamed protein product [Dicrocoelium dendriticum]|nr:unnamed protein product [Dicrocoelium dendriticum]